MMLIKTQRGVSDEILKKETNDPSVDDIAKGFKVRQETC